MSSLRLTFLKRLIFANYCRVSESKSVNFVARLYCIVVSSIVCFFYFSNIFVDLHFIANKFSLFSMIEFLFYIILSLVYAEEKFFKYCYAIKTGDAIMGYKKIALMPIYMYYIMTANAFLRLITSALRLTLATHNTYIFISIFFVTVSMDFNYMVLIFIFSLLHSRLNLLKTVLQRNFVPFDAASYGKVTACIKNIRLILYSYNNLLDNIFIVEKQLQLMLFVNLVTSLPKVVFTLYTVVRKILMGTYDLLTFLTIVEEIQLISLFCYPAIVAELAKYEVEQIKITLSKQLLRCSDDCLRLELKAALEYVSSRPFSYVVARVVPLDISLPFNIISIAITYVIVIIQFYHFSA